MYRKECIIMRFGVCLPGNFTLPNSPAEGCGEQIRALVDGYRFIQEVGYDYIEFGVGNFANFTEDDMAQAVDFYNNRRPHMSINMMTPKQAAGCKGEIKKMWNSRREQAIKQARI